MPERAEGSVVARTSPAQTQTASFNRRYRVLLSREVALSPPPLEERVAEHAVLLSRSAEISHAGIKHFRADQAGRNSWLADALDHRSERSPRKTIRQVRAARIHVHHPG